LYYLASLRKAAWLTFTRRQVRLRQAEERHTQFLPDLVNFLKRFFVFRQQVKTQTVIALIRFSVVARPAHNGIGDFVERAAFLLRFIQEVFAKGADGGE
jgi:hypothetical protein